jgi:predicted DNA-binding protein (UPF0251 family)
MKDISTVEIQLDQFEAMRLCDQEGLDQTEAGQKMGISRGTVQRLLYRGRKQLMKAILHNSAIIVNLKNSGVDDVSMCTNTRRRGTGRGRS